MRRVHIILEERIHHKGQHVSSMETHSLKIAGKWQWTSGFHLNHLMPYCSLSNLHSLSARASARPLTCQQTPACLSREGPTIHKTTTRQQEAEIGQHMDLRSSGHHNILIFSREWNIGKVRNARQDVQVRVL